MLSFRDARAVWSMNGGPDRSIDRRTAHPEGERGRQLGTRSAPICRGGCQSLSMLRDRSRVKGKKTRQGRLSIGIVERIPVLDHWKTYWIRFKAESQPRGAPSLGRLATFLAVSWYTHRSWCLFSIRYVDPRLKKRQLSKWRIQVALVHEIGLTQTLDRPGKLPASVPRRLNHPSSSIVSPFNREEKRQLQCNGCLIFHTNYP